MNNTQEQVEARQNKGFTLIELLIVIAILGILSVVVVLSVGGTTTNAKLKACTADKATVSIAAEAYNASTGGYPTTDAALMSPVAYLQAPSTSYSVVGSTAATLSVNKIAGNVNGCL